MNTKKSRLSRRQVLRNSLRGAIGCAAMPLAIQSASPILAANPVRSTAKISNVDLAQKKRLVIMFSPNGIVPKEFWPDTDGAKFELKRILKPLEAFRENTLILDGICNQVRGDGDSHMRGMSCLLTGTELFPGNIQGGSDTPAGWSKGISIDQEIKNFLQSNEQTKTKFGSLEFGVQVPNEATPWSRMVYSGPNEPVAAISDPYQMFQRMYGQVQDRDNLLNVFGTVNHELEQLAKRIESEGDAGARKILETHRAYMLESEKQMKQSGQSEFLVPRPNLEKDVANENDNIPTLSRMQIELLVNGFANDLNRIATLQYSRSVGNMRMRWLGIQEGHHQLSHEPDENKKAQEELTKINTWFCEQLVYLVKRLSETKEPGTDSSLLDNTLIVWTNELGKGNSHTLNNIPMILVGGSKFGFEMGQHIKLKRSAHNPLWLAIANAMGHEIDVFGNPEFCESGPLNLGT